MLGHWMEVGWGYAENFLSNEDSRGICGFGECGSFMQSAFATGHFGWVGGREKYEA